MKVPGRSIRRPTDRLIGWAVLDLLFRLRIWNSPQKFLTLEAGCYARTPSNYLLPKTVPVEFSHGIFVSVPRQRTRVVGKVTSGILDMYDILDQMLTLGFFRMRSGEHNFFFVTAQ